MKVYVFVQFLFDILYVFSLLRFRVIASNNPDISGEKFETIPPSEFPEVFTPGFVSGGKPETPGIELVTTIGMPFCMYSTHHIHSGDLSIEEGQWKWDR